MAFCRVDAGPHDPDLGFIPDHEVDERLVVRSLLSKSRARGIGAGMAVRRRDVLSIGGFDEQLGPGGRLRSGEDRDLAARALAAGWWVLQIPDAFVVHHGFRTWAQGRSLTRRDWYGIGAAYAKQLKCRNLAIVAVIAHEVVWFGLIKPVAGFLFGRRHNGLRRIGYFASGLVAGLRTPVDALHDAVRRRGRRRYVTVTVVTPVFNGADHLRATLSSVQAQTLQRLRARRGRRRVDRRIGRDRARGRRRGHSDPARAAAPTPGCRPPATRASATPTRPTSSSCSSTTTTCCAPPRSRCSSPRCVRPRTRRRCTASSQRSTAPARSCRWCASRPPPGAPSSTRTGGGRRASGDACARAARAVADRGASATCCSSTRSGRCCCAGSGSPQIGEFDPTPARRPGLRPVAADVVPRADRRTCPRSCSTTARPAARCRRIRRRRAARTSTPASSASPTGELPSATRASGPPPPPPPRVAPRRRADGVRGPGAASPRPRLAQPAIWCGPRGRPAKRCSRSPPFPWLVRRPRPAASGAGGDSMTASTRATGGGARSRRRSSRSTSPTGVADVTGLGGYVFALVVVLLDAASRSVRSASRSRAIVVRPRRSPRPSRPSSPTSCCGCRAAGGDGRGATGPMPGPRRPLAVRRRDDRRTVDVDDGRRLHPRSPRAVAAVPGALCRQRTPASVVVIDNAPSTDATARLVAERLPRVRATWSSPGPASTTPATGRWRRAPPRSLAYTDDDAVAGRVVDDGARHRVRRGAGPGDGDRAGAARRAGHRRPSRCSSASVASVVGSVGAGRAWRRARPVAGSASASGAPAPTWRSAVRPSRRRRVRSGARRRDRHRGWRRPRRVPPGARRRPAGALRTGRDRAPRAPPSMDELTAQFGHNGAVWSMMAAARDADRAGLADTARVVGWYATDRWPRAAAPRRSGAEPGPAAGAGGRGRWVRPGGAAP